MLRRLSLLLPGLLVFASIYAQTSRITGRVTEEDSGAPVVQAGVQVLSAVDSSQVEISVTDLEGRFSIAVPSGDYILKFSFTGFTTQFRNIHQTASNQDFSLGVIQMSPDMKILKAAVVAAKVEPVTVVGDTVVYNAAAYRVAEDASLDELLKKIPGLEISPSGSVTLQGKTVKQILINGKRYFGGDVKTGLKNLQADMVENIRAYERPSDFSRLTGIDDGEEEPVLDLTVKKSMMDGWRGNLSGALGNEKRLNFRANMNKITKEQQYTVIGGVRNTVGKIPVSTTSRSQLGTGSAGESLFSEAGVNFSRDWKKVELSGHVQYTGDSSETQYTSHSESLSSPTSVTYSSATGTGSRRSNVLKADLSVEWRPTPQWTFFVKPQINYNYSSRLSHPESDQFSDALETLITNTSRNNTASFDKKLSLQIEAQATRRFASKKGRTLSLRGYYAAKPDHSSYFYDYNTYYYKKAEGKNVTQRLQYVDFDPSGSYARLQLSYSEPFVKGFSLQMTLMGDFRRTNYKKDTYTFLYKTYGTVHTDFFPDYEVLDTHSLSGQLDNLPEGYESAYDTALSPNGTYKYNALVSTVNLRYFRKRLTLIAGFQARPQWTRMDYTNEGEAFTREDFLFNIAPFVTFKYRRQKTRQISFTYRSSVGSPSLYNLLPVQNGNSPTSIHIGNPSLRPSFTHRLNFDYNYSDLRKQNSLVVNVGCNFVQNATVNNTIYEPGREILEEYGLYEELGDLGGTGVRLTIPENIDGNWNAKATCSFNQTFTDSRFSMSNHAAAEFADTKSYLYSSSTRQSDLNVSTRFIVKDLLEFCSRFDAVEILVSGGAEYTSEHNALRPDLDQEPLSITAGAVLTLTLPWEMRISADYTFLSQSGYAFSELNRGYHFLNAGIAQPLLRRRATLRFDYYDILGQQINLVRTFGSSSRSISQYNGVNSYFLVTFVYRFKL